MSNLDEWSPSLSCVCARVCACSRTKTSITINDDVQHTEAASEKYEVRCSEASQTIEALKVTKRPDYDNND